MAFQAALRHVRRDLSIYVDGIRSAGLAVLVFTILGGGFGWLVPPCDAGEPNPQPSATRTNAEQHFRESVAPIFARRCLTCHDDQQRKGGLSLQTAATALEGGASGDVIVPGDPQSSRLLDLITPRQGRAQMPRDADPLSDEEVEAVRRWIAEGADWPEEMRIDQAVVDDTDWWSLRPLEQPPIPPLSPEAARWVRNPIDAFIAAGHRELGLQPSPPADRRTLIRRLYIDLTGLPPTYEQIEAFVADPDAQAYEKLVDRLLASPHYGERWARHWLDVVQYGETHGYDKDQPRENAWPYRDYVVRSLNQDKPYARFVQEQLAGDVLFPGTVDGIEALGFIAAGPWDLIGHAEVPETRVDGQIARHLDRDDMVQNTMLTFNSMTVGCAQCHHHRSDPIRQEEYYGLQAVFAALDRTDQPYYDDADDLQLFQRLTAERRKLNDRKMVLEAEIKQQGGERLAQLERRIAEAEQPEQRPAEHGYHSAIMPSPDYSKWVQVDLGESTEIAAIELIGCHDDFNDIGAGFGFPVRYKIELADDPEFERDVYLAVDRTQHDVPNPGVAAQLFKLSGVMARYVRITATKLAPRQNDFIFALAELKVFDSAGDNLARNKPVAALDSIEAPIRWSKKNLVNGIYPRAAGEDERQRLIAERKRLLESAVDTAVRSEHAEVASQLQQVEARFDQLPPPRHVYIAAVHHGEGNFAGRGKYGGTPRPIHVLHRGEVTSPGSEVDPGAPAYIDELPGEFDLPEQAEEGQRRAALAHWLTDKKNPLTWRSIVNRIWLYHFGRGIVDSPNDFGRMGQLPTHPELLDWLAAEFRDGNQSWKELHRLIVTSATYRQASSPSSEPPEVDADNRYYWRMNRRRLEAEAVRDAMLQASGELDLTMGGPSFRDFVIENPEHSPHYQYHLHDPEDPRSHRRAVYRFIVRSQTQPFMTALDCADPSMQVAKRDETVTPLQALVLLNNKLSLVMARHFAERVQRETTAGQGGDRLDEPITRAFQIALGRLPSDQERSMMVSYAAEHGIANACRVILNLNEFMFVD